MDHFKSFIFTVVATVVVIAASVAVSFANWESCRDVALPTNL